MGLVDEDNVFGEMNQTALRAVNAIVLTSQALLFAFRLSSFPHAGFTLAVACNFSASELKRNSMDNLLYS